MKIEETVQVGFQWTPEERLRVINEIANRAMDYFDNGGDPCGVGLGTIRGSLGLINFVAVRSAADLNSHRGEFPVNQRS